jgi:hypothetical protein
MKQSTIIVTIIFIFGMFLINTQTEADETLPSHPYSGELGYRSTLTGDIMLNLDQFANRLRTTISEVDL